MDTTLLKHPEWKQVVSVLIDRDYGAVIIHAEMEKISNISRSRNPQKYYHTIKRAAKYLLREHFKLLRNIYERGYEITLPVEHKHESRKSLKASHQKINESVEQLIYTPQSLLSDRDNRMNADMLAKLGTLKQHADKVIIQTSQHRLEKRADMPKMLSAK